MNNAEQFLTDLEAKAKNTGEKKWVPVTKEFFGDISCDVEDEKNTVIAFDLPPCVAEFIAAANPAAVLRLVGMVRHLALGCDRDAEACQYGHCTPTCRLQMAYNDSVNYGKKEVDNDC